MSQRPGRHRMVIRKFILHSSIAAMTGRGRLRNQHFVTESADTLVPNGVNLSLKYSLRLY
jgi:hypothetical protein